MRIREITLTKGDAHLHLDLDSGGRATRLGIGDLDVLARPDTASPFHWGSFVMAPWAGRIRDGRFSVDGQPHQLAVNWPPHAIHGTVADRPWWCVEHTETEAVIDCPLDDRWPWRGYVRQRISLDEDAARFRIEVHADDTPFPAAAGWHPWFARQLARGESLELAVTAEAILERDDVHIPTGERRPIPPQPWDDCFDRVSWPVTLTWPDALELDVSGDTRYGVIFTEPDDAVCVEPQTGPPDALNLEPALVTPGSPLTAEMTWRWRTV
jgi:aldose 1-epimerase